jgi:hypothetical protein
MNRWIHRSFTLLAGAAITLAGASSFGQGAKVGATATTEVKPGAGPLEKAGSAADKAIDKAGDKIDKAGDKAAAGLDKAADKAGEGADKAADKADKAADKAAEAADKAADKADKAAEKAEDKADKAAEKVANTVERLKAKAKSDRDELRGKVKVALKGQPMSEAMKQELKRHARRLARLERVKDVAKASADSEATARVDTLIDKENARHTKWMANFEAKADVKAGAK